MLRKILRMKTKNFEEISKFQYSVCEIAECEKESYRLAMTETKFVDFCENHYEEYILGEK